MPYWLTPNYSALFGADAFLKVSPAFEPGSFSKGFPMSFGLTALPPFSSPPCAMFLPSAPESLPPFDATGLAVLSEPSELLGAETFSTYSLIVSPAVFGCASSSISSVATASIDSSSASSDSSSPSSSPISISASSAGASSPSLSAIIASNSALRSSRASSRSTRGLPFRRRRYNLYHLQRLHQPSCHQRHRHQLLQLLLLRRSFLLLFLLRLFL